MKPSNSAPVYGVVLPPNIIEKWLHTSVTVTESGGQIILQSGALPLQLSKEEIKINTEVIDKIRI